MSKNLRDIPFSELVEVVQDLSRTNADNKKRIRGIINRKYTKGIPREDDWYFMKVTTSLSLIAEYKTGVVTVNSGETLCTFSGGVTITSAMTGRKIKFSNNNNVYDFTFNDSTGGNIAPALSLTTNVSNGTYTIFQPIYSLPSDFDRFPRNGGLLFYTGGQPTPLPEKHDDDYYSEYTSNPTSTPEACRILSYDTAGNLQVEIVPPPSNRMVLGTEYIRQLKPMKETTAGTVSITSSLAVVTGSNGSLFTTMNTGDYLRVDAFGTGDDSTWCRVDSITNDTTMTISPVFRSDTSVVGATYTVSSIPEYPPKLQEALIYGSIRDVFSDQNDPTFIYYNLEYAKIMTDNKIHIQTRRSKDELDLMASDFNFRR